MRGYESRKDSAVPRGCWETVQHCVVFNVHVWTDVGGLTLTAIVKGNKQITNCQKWKLLGWAEAISTFSSYTIPGRTSGAW